jgi:putative sterol carrier protein
MSLDSIRDKMSTKLAGFNHTVKFDFEEDGVVFVDATQNPPVVSDEDQDAEVTLRTSVETLEKIISGAQDPNIAFMMGKLKVSGSMGLALKLNSILED